MENYEEGRAKLLTLLSEIQGIVGDFDTSSIFEKFELTSAHQQDHQYERERDHPRRSTGGDITHTTTALQHISIPNIDMGVSPKFRPKLSISTHISPPTAYVSGPVDSGMMLHVEDTESGTCALHTPVPSHKRHGLFCLTSHSISPTEESGSMVATPSSYRQKRFVNNRSNWHSVPQHVAPSTATGSLQHEIQHHIEDTSFTTKRPPRLQTPVKSISAFMEDLPTNSPVRTLMSKFISNSSPIRSKTEEELKRTPVPQKGPKILSDDARTRARARKVVSLLEFVYVGIDADLLDGSDFVQESTERDQMIKLNKLQHCDVKLLDQFKLNKCDEEARCMVESISDYCFPDGVLVDVMLRSDIGKYTGPELHSMHIMQFSDVTGSPTYACCLAVTEAFEPKNKQIVRALLLRRRKYSKSVTIIIKAFRRFLHKRKIDLLNVPKNVCAEISIFDRKHAFYSMGTPFKFGGARSNAEADDGEGGRQLGVGLGSVIMSTLKKGMSFAGGRTSDKAAPPRVKENKNKLSWMDFNDDDSDSPSLNPDKRDRFLSTLESAAGHRGRKGKRRNIDSENKSEGENANEMSWHDDDDEDDDEDNEEDDDDDEGMEQGWRSSDSKRATDSKNIYSEDVLHKSALPVSPFSPTDGIFGIKDRKMSQYSGDQRIEFSPHYFSQTRGDDGVPDRGHCLKDLEGLHLHGFSSESEEETETDDAESSFDSERNNILDQVLSTGESDAIQALTADANTQCVTSKFSHDQAISSDPISSVPFIEVDDQIYGGQTSMQPDPASGPKGIEAQAVTAVAEVFFPKPCVVLEDVSDYVIVTKRALCMLSATPLHTLSFSVSTHFNLSYCHRLFSLIMSSICAVNSCYLLLVVGCPCE